MKANFAMKHICIGITAHVDAGKTTLSEAMLYQAGALKKLGRVLNRLPENSSDLLDSMIKWPDNSDASAWYYLAVQEATNSHAYSDKSKDDKYEKWTTIRDARDWTELEK